MSKKEVKCEIVGLVNHLDYIIRGLDSALDEKGWKQ